MNDKSHVSLATRHCIKCNKEYETNELILDTRIIKGELAKTLDKYTCVGLGCCPDCEKELIDHNEVLFYSVVDCGEGLKIRTVYFSENVREGIADESGIPKDQRIYETNDAVLDYLITMGHEEPTTQQA